MKRLSRRTFLRGAVAGATVSLALPPLDAMLGSGSAKASELDAPIFGIFFWANGLPWHPGHGAAQGAGRDLWTPTEVGAGFAPSELLMEPARHRVSLATGLEPHTEIPPNPPGQEDGHMRGFMNALTGDRIRPEGFDHGPHILTALRPSIDQYVAKHPDFYGSALPRFRSLEVGVSGSRFHDYGHWNAISYNGPDSLNLPIMRASQLYAMLFGTPVDTAELGRRSRLLDAVLDDARSLRAELGAADRARIDAHLEHMYEIQRRLDHSAVACEAPAAPGPVGDAAAASGDLMGKTGAMADLLAVALSCGLTRVFSFMLTAPATNHVFDNVGVANALHQAVHDGNWRAARAAIGHQMQCFGRFLDALAAHADPTGATLLDRACVLGLSEYGEGYQHSVKEMPTVIAGRASGRLLDNVHVRIPGGNIARLHLTALQAIGLEETQWGWNGAETTEVLPGLLA